jgi:hypothetical protein
MMAEKTYKNVGVAPVLGQAPGKVFKADLPEAQQKRMEARRSIEEVDPKAAAEQHVEPEETVDVPETGGSAGLKDGEKKVEPGPPAPTAAQAGGKPLNNEKKG